MKWWLIVFVLVDGEWVHGKDLETPGWGPRAYDTEEVCLLRKSFAEQAVKERSKTPSKWFCTEQRDAVLSDLEAAGLSQ